MAPHEQALASGPNRRGRSGGAERTPRPGADQDWTRCLVGGGEMGDRIRAFDWSSTPLGPIGE